MSSRRKFLRNTVTASLALPALKAFGLSEEEIEKRMIPYERKYSPNDVIRVAGIGMGIMGFGNAKTALELPGVEFVAACDLYDGRLERAQHDFGGKNQIFTTKDYRQILNRKDIDAIIISTTDHWHDKISIEAMNAGKHIYCEKPMVHHIEEGHAVIAAEKKNKSIYQVGSQRASSIAFARAKELFKAGEIGQLNMIEATYDRQSALGAWQYTIPPDASPATIDWQRYLGDAPKRPFDPVRFFRWRNYRDYGTGVAGDLFVHLVTGIHFLTDSYGPSRIFASGQLAYWKDGRDVPDVMVGIMDYPATDKHPAFNVTLRVNFVSGQGGTGVTKLIGSEGYIDFGWNDFKLYKNKMPKAPGYGGWDSYETFPEKTQKEIAAAYDAKWSKQDREAPKYKPIEFKTPDGYDDRKDHFMNFFESMRTKKPVVEDATFGLRAAAPCLACNDSYFAKRPIKWDPVKMRVIG